MKSADKVERELEKFYWASPLQVMYACLCHGKGKNPCFVFQNLMVVCRHGNVMVADRAMKQAFQRSLNECAVFSVHMGDTRRSQFFQNVWQRVEHVWPIPDLA